MNMKMPHVLITIRFVVLPGGYARAIIRFAYSYPYLLYGFISFRQYFVSNRIKIFIVVIGDDNNMSWIIGPPLRTNKGRDIFVLINNVPILLVFGFITV